MIDGGQEKRAREGKEDVESGRTLKRIVRKLLDCVVPPLWLCSSPTHMLLLLPRTYAALTCANLDLVF